MAYGTHLAANRKVAVNVNSIDATLSSGDLTGVATAVTIGTATLLGRRHIEPKIMGEWLFDN